MAGGRSDLRALALAGDALVASCDAVAEDGWDGSTPCSEWTVGDLVDHVVGGNVFTIEILDGRTADDALRVAMAGFGDGYDRRDSLAATTLKQREAFVRAGALAGRYHHIAGVLSGVEIVRARIHDLIIHGWDLAEAIAPPATIPEPLVEWAIGELGTASSLTAATFGIDAAELHDGPTLLDAFGRTH